MFVLLTFISILPEPNHFVYHAFVCKSLALRGFDLVRVSASFGEKVVDWPR